MATPEFQAIITRIPVARIADMVENRYYDDDEDEEEDFDEEDDEYDDEEDGADEEENGVPGEFKNGACQTDTPCLGVNARDGLVSSVLASRSLMFLWRSTSVNHCGC